MCQLPLKVTLWVGGWCFGGSAAGLAYGAGQRCVVVASSREWGFTASRTVGASSGLTAALSTGFIFSPDAQVLADLQGTSVDIGWSTRFFFGVQGDYSTGQNAVGQTINVVTGSASAGWSWTFGGSDLKRGLPFEVHGGSQETVAGNPLRDFWDYWSQVNAVNRERMRVEDPDLYRRTTRVGSILLKPSVLR